MNTVRRFDTVHMATTPGALGLVRRVARDGSWADVRWVQHTTGEQWDKRQHDVSLLIVVAPLMGSRAYPALENAA